MVELCSRRSEIIMCGGEINKYSGAYEIPDDSEVAGGYVVKISNKE